MTKIKITDDMMKHIANAMNEQAASQNTSDCASTCCAQIIRDERQEFIKKELNKPFEINILQHKTFLSHTTIICETCLYLNRGR